MDVSSASVPTLPRFHPGEIWRDTDGVPINAHGAGMLYHNGVYYWYGEFKIAGPEGNAAQVGVSCYSSTDLLQWKNEGIVLPVVEDEAHDLARGCILERPKVLYNAHTQRFVVWFHLELLGQGYGSARVGVASSDSPTGPFTYHRSFRPDGEMSRDMTLFADPDAFDGTAYLFCASDDNQTIHIARLSDDYLGTSGEYVRVFPGRYMEAPAVCKHNDRYWFIGSGCTGWAPNAARSAVAETPFGPWQELGNPCIGPNAELTFGAQSTYILPVAGKPGTFILLADRWNPDNPIDGRYVWLPLEFTADAVIVRWQDEWSL